jgi:hypothetical protein
VNKTTTAIPGLLLMQLSKFSKAEFTRELIISRTIYKLACCSSKTTHQQTHIEATQYRHRAQYHLSNEQKKKTKTHEEDDLHQIE